MNKQEIITAILSNKNVYWRNEAYNVIYNNNHLYVIYKYNDYMTALQSSEYVDCFINEE